MFFETPISDWTQIAVFLLCATISIPIATIGGIKLFIMVHKKILDKEKKD